MTIDGEIPVLCSGAFFNDVFWRGSLLGQGKFNGDFILGTLDNLLRFVNGLVFCSVTFLNVTQGH